MKRILTALAILIAALTGAQAQNATRVIPLQNNKPVNASNPLYVQGTFSATLSGFAPGASYASLTATGSSARTALPTGITAVVFNTGTTAVSCALGNSSITAVANENIIQASSWLAFTVGSNVDIACIDQGAADTTSNVVVISGGAGLPTGAGGGGSGGSGLSVTDGASFTASTSPFTPSGGEYNSSPSALTSGKQGMLALNQYRAAFVDVMTSNSNLYTALTSSIPCLNATAYNTNSYTTGSTSPVSCDLNSNFYVSGMPTLLTAVQSPPPMNVNGTATAQTGSTPGTVQTGTVIAANTAPVPAASGGLTTYFLQPTASTNSVNVKATAGQVYWVLAENNSATVNYLRFYNSASGPTCSSATGLITQIQIPASTSVGGVNIPLPFGIPFSTGIGICVTSGYATTDTTNATATAISLTIGYN